MPDGTFDQGVLDSGTFDDPLADGGAAAERLLGYLPRWLQGPLSRAVCEAIGQQLDEFDLLAFADQLFVATASWGLAFEVPNADGATTPTGWERDYGLASVSTDTEEVRRARVLARRRAHAIRTAADFVAFVRAILVPAATADPTAYTAFGRWVVYKPADRGWVTNFEDVEAALALAGPAHVGQWLAPHREAPDSGLTVAQLAMMRTAAVSVLTVAEIEGD
jgi:hypothetical protein